MPRSTRSKPAKATQKSTPVVNDEVDQSSSSPPPVEHIIRDLRVKGSSSKRKAEEQPSPESNNIHTKRRLARPGTPDFDDLPAVSLRSPSTSSKKMHTLRFGSVEPDEPKIATSSKKDKVGHRSASSPTLSSDKNYERAPEMPRSSRSRVPSSKVRYMKPDPDSPSPSPLKSATVKGTAKPDSKTTRSKHRQETESIISISSGSEDSTAPIKGQKGKGKRQSVGKSGNTSSVVRIKQERQETHASKAESDHREMDSESKSHANDRSKKSRKTEPESDVEGQGTSPSNSIHEFVVPDDAPIEYDSGSDKESPQPVIDHDTRDALLQDPALKKYYKRLEPLKKVYFLPQSNSAKPNNLLMYSKVCGNAGVTDEAKIMLLSALEFISYDCFINPSRAPLSLVKKKDDRLVMSDRPDNTAVLLITGLAVDSNLIEPYEHTYMGNTTRVKRLLLWPFSQEFELAISYIGNAWGVEHVSIPIDGGIFKFSTRKDTAQSNNSGAYKSPVKMSKMASLVNNFSSPTKGQSPAKQSANWHPSVLNFDDHVPIYNGLEENFSFDKRGFSRFKKLPLWKKGLAEIPPFSLVTVGFAPSIFVSTSDSSKGANILMPNILFAVIWGSYDV